MQQEIDILNARNQIQQKQQEFFNLLTQSERDLIGEGLQGVCYKFGNRVYKFLNLEGNSFSLNELRQMNRSELMFLQELACSDYTCEVETNQCDSQFNLWITTAYMNQGNINMDCLYNKSDVNKLSLETLQIICKRLIKILNYFHSKQIFHLDVRPDNILLHEEYQFSYQISNNGQEFEIHNGLQQLGQQLLTKQQYQREQIQPDYVQLQYILDSKFQQLNHNEPKQLINVRFNELQDVNELIYWIEKWLRFNDRLQFNPHNIYIKKGIRICFCDFGLAQRIDITNTDRPTFFQYGLYKTPYQILGGIIQQQQVNAWNIARQQDLFKLGCTMCNLLQNNGYIEAQASQMQFNDKNLDCLYQFIRETFNQNVNNLAYQILAQQILPQDKTELLKYYSYYRQLDFLIRNRVQNHPFYLMIQQMLIFSFTPSNLFNQLDQNNQDLPQEIIKVKDSCKQLQMNIKQ